MEYLATILCSSLELTIFNIGELTVSGELRSEPRDKEADLKVSSDTG